jgi:predicted nucleotidyltransferase
MSKEESTLNLTIFNEAKKFRQLLAKNGLGIMELYIFGSHAKGKANRSSDIDIAVVSDDFSADRQGERVKLMAFSQQINLAIEPHPFSSKDFNDPYYPLACEIKKTGIKI